MQDSILIIDDDLISREIIKDIIIDLDYIIYEADNGLTGFQKLQSAIINIVITDIIMPDMDGMEVIMKLKTLYPDIKIIAISSGGFGTASDYLSIAAELGADKIISKPLKPDDVIKALNALNN